MLECFVQAIIEKFPKYYKIWQKQKPPLKKDGFYRVYKVVFIFLEKQRFIFYLRARSSTPYGYTVNVKKFSNFITGHTCHIAI